jgi:hypothetical protein
MSYLQVGIEPWSMIQNRQGPPDVSPEFKQFGNDWQTGYPEDRLIYAENYRQGRLALIYHVHIAVIPKVNEGRVPSAEMRRPDSELNAVAVFTSNRFNPADLYLRDQEPVFVGNVEVMYGVDRIAIPSLVRLYLVEEFPAYCDEGCLFFSLPEKFFEMRSAWVDRKVDLRFGRRISSGQLEPFEIESASEIVESVAKDEGKIRGNRFCRSDFERFIAGSRVSIHDDAVDTAFAELPDAGVKIVDVLFGPFQL